MHDCRKTQLQMMDWLFDEPTQNATPRMAELSSCQSCYELFHASRSALHAFDQATDALLPEENYWAGYEASLRVKLAADAAPRRWPHRAWRSAWRWMLPAAVGVVILLLVVLGSSRTPQPPTEEPIAFNPKTAARENEPEAPKYNPKKRRADKPAKPERKEPSRLPDKKPYLLTDPNPILAMSIDAPLVHPATTKHFERAQLLLRAFRNAPATANATFELAYEKKRARHLLYATILLRREAETRGDWPMEEVLNHLEPLLLDIANLPQRPTVDDVTPIKERMQKQEIVAKLQLYAMPLTVVALAE
jgi:hypothetical protein